MSSARLETLNTPARAPVRPSAGRALRLVERLSVVLTTRSVVPIALVLMLVIGLGDFRDLLFGMLLSGLATLCVVAGLDRVENTLGSAGPGPIARGPAPAAGCGCIAVSRNVAIAMVKIGRHGTA